MWKNIKLDERQIKIRGDIFRHGFIFTLVLLLGNAFLAYKKVIWAETIWQNVIIAMLPATVCIIEKILKDIITEERNAFRRLPYMFGVVSVAGFVFAIIEKADGQSAVANGTLTELGVYIILNSLFALIFVAFIAKTIYSRRQQKED